MHFETLERTLFETRSWSELLKEQGVGFANPKAPNLSFNPRIFDTKFSILTSLISIAKPLNLNL